MSVNHNQFSSKLSELEFEYRQMINRIQLCQKGSHEEIVRVQKVLVDECKEQETLLSELMVSGRSKAIKKLSAMHLRYFREVRDVLEETIPQYLDTVNRPNDSNQAEAMALYAEFAIDNAIQAIRYALVAAFSAVEMQMKADEADEI